MTRYTPSHALPRPARGLPLISTSVVFERVRPAARILGRTALVITMAVLSVVLWVASPLAWLWIAARVTDSSHPGLGPYVLLFAGVLLTAVPLTRLLSGADRAYKRLAGTPDRRLHRSWLRASGQHELERPKAGPLGVVMGVSVLAAVIALVVLMLTSGHAFEPVPLFGVR